MKINIDKFPYTIYLYVVYNFKETNKFLKEKLENTYTNYYYLNFYNIRNIKNILLII